MSCRLTAYPPPSFTRRRGLTLIEVVVVLAILGIAGALVVSRQVQRTGSQRVESADDLHVVVDSARRLAVQRQQVVRLRIYADGLWSVLSPDAPEPIAAGRMTAPPAPLDVTVDARGGCRPSAGWVPREELRAAFDAGTCRWAAPAGRTAPAGARP